MLTTTAMIKLGKVYENMMVDLQPKSQKLIERSKKIIMLATDKNYEEASFFLKKSHGHIKSAILMALTGLDLESAEDCIEKNKGFIKKALQKCRRNEK